MDRDRVRRQRAAFEAFVETSLDERLDARLALDPATTAIAFFHAFARDVPAYKTFLDEQGIDPASMVTPHDFARLPLVTKASPPTSSARSRSCASPWARGLAACSPPPVAGTSRRRGIRSSPLRRAT